MSDLIPWDAIRNLEHFFRAVENYFNAQLKALDKFFEGIDVHNIKVQEERDRTLLHFIVPEELKNKLDVRVEGDKVEVFGQTSSSEKNSHSAAASWKSFYQCYRLPKRIAAEKAQVYFKGNRLTVEIPKT
ncbi:hypothetical protein Tfer_0838 [Thermincola ferriacetica]|uniref:SHSP domain-containing protein n=1 Tax=Thermincola ferriacetica TaxID=281456 RepID=A0A0L6W5J8_9FIRM|nr:Hsp20/alpha crystallin family protein [Thermincola ferriacetica]KNZ70648.1 hypothetical protein Tfer_0838 [Thermincola ferriacetica]